MIRSLTLLLLLGVPAMGNAQSKTEAAEAPAKPAPEKAAEKKDSPRPIRPQDYGQWESLGFSTLLSPDGRWLSYSINRINGENELRLRMLATDAVETFDHGRSPSFSQDAKWFACLLGVSADERENAQKSGKTLENRLMLRDLVTGKEHEIKGVSSFSFSENGRYLAMQRYPIKGRKSSGRDIVLRDLETGRDTNFGNVSSRAWNEEGTLLALVIDAENKAGNGIQLFDTRSGRLSTLDSQDSRYKSLTWREDSSDLAVLREVENEDDKDENLTHDILVWYDAHKKTPTARVFEVNEQKTFPSDMNLVATSGLRWSDDGQTVFFGIKKKEMDEDKDANKKGKGKGKGKESPSEDKDKPSPKESDKESLSFFGDEKPGQEGKGKGKEKPAKSLRETLKDPAGVEVWHAKDIDIIPRQKRTASQDERRSHLAAWWPKERAFVRLGDETVENVSLFEGQKHGFGTDNTPYETLRRFGPTLNDAYVIDARTGDRHKVLEKLKYFYGTSPKGRYVVYVRDNHIWTYDIKDRAHRNLTAAVDVPFINQEMSSLTDEKPPYGVAAWSEDGKDLYLYDRWDLWRFRADGTKRERLTEGREQKIRYRRVRLDFEEDEHVHSGKPIYLSVYGDRTKKFGYARRLASGEVEELIYKDKNVGRLIKAEDADVFAFVEQAFDDSPDIWVTDANLESPRQVTETNPFQSKYQWGHAELVDFRNVHGQELQGSLYYPAGYEEGKKYPMLVYIYELRSQVLHSYSVPTERHPYNPAVYTAEGYFVFQPDIVYRAQNPGLSAVECVVPAVEKVLESGMIDKDRIGLVGHSWGAYQTSFIVTQTDLFAAGVAGAPLTNMMSMSMSIYWNSGQTDAWIFHESQGRMDRPFWQDVETYIKNSPIFSIDNLNTPLLVAFGDEDGAVDWHQGIEMYNAARLAQKPFVMLVYAGENHSLRKKPNQVDYHYRVLEWFGHYLKGDEAKPWITDGVKHLDRKRELEAQKKKGKKGPR